MSVDEFAKAISKKYGAGTVWRISERPQTLDTSNVIPSGSLALDAALGVGGYPRGRITEILGNPGSGKTTTTLHAIAEAQKLGLECLFIDAEHALDLPYAERIGVDVDRLYITQPDYGEQALTIAEEAIRSGKFGVVVVDSVAALVPLRELEGESGDSHMGLQARMMSQACRRISGAINKSNTLVIFINQYRSSMSTGGYGGPSKVPTGGKALDYYASVKIDISRTKSIADRDGVIVAQRTQAKIVKNKVAPPYRVAEFDIVLGEGINTYGEIIDLAVEYDIIRKGGAWYTYGEEKMQGRENMMSYLKQNERIFEDIYALVKARISGEVRGGGEEVQASGQEVQGGD